MTESIEFGPLTADGAHRIADWRYPGDYAMYDIPPEDRESSVEYMLDPANGYFGAYIDGELVGFCVIGPDGRVSGWDYDDSAVDVGAGMRPDLTGRGHGGEFMAAVVRFVAAQVGDVRLRATVASWNHRALKAVQRAGFVSIGSFVGTRGIEFTVLVRSERSSGVARSTCR